MTPSERAFLARHRLAHLATVDAAGRPHALPVCFALVDEAIYTPLDEKPKRADPRTLRRIRNILAQPAVCLVVDDYDEDWSRLAWLQVRGVAALVEDQVERTGALAALRAKYPRYREMGLEARPLIRIDARKVVGWAAVGSV